MTDPKGVPSLADVKVVPREATSAQLYAGQKAWLADPERKSSTLYRAMVEAAPPSEALARAIAAARAEGRKAGLEEAAKCTAALAEHYYSQTVDETWSDRDRHMQLGRTHAAAIAVNGIRALISTTKTDTASPADGGRA